MNTINAKQVINVIYTNYKGETNFRKIIPQKIWFGSTDWHPEDQWMLDAYDIDKKANRSFAIKDIKTFFIEKTD